MGTRKKFITALFFIVIIVVSLAFMVWSPVKITYQEKDGQPGYTEGDTLVSELQLGPYQSIIRYPDVYLALVITTVLGFAGLFYTVREEAYEETAVTDHDSRDVPPDTEACDSAE